MLSAEILPSKLGVKIFLGLASNTSSMNNIYLSILGQSIVDHYLKYVSG